MADPVAVPLSAHAAPRQPRLLVTLCTYNERGNIERLISEIHRCAPDAHVLVIDDNSPDGTGASAGGPSALVKLLSALPGEFPAAIVVVQHVDEHFAGGLAVWLSSHTALRVRLAEEGDRPTVGTVFLAAKENHLVLASPTHLGYTRQPVDSSYRPSVDVFFNSVVEHWRGAVYGVLLTGMGRDGAEGLKALRHRGHHTIAQDRATSAVYGMPKAAAELDAATEILALDKIAPHLTNMLMYGKRI